MYLGVITCCYVLLRVVTCCYIFRAENFVKVLSRFTFYIRFQPSNTLLHMLIGLVTCCYAFLHVVTSLEGKRLSKLVQGSHFYSFPTHEYLVTYLHWACYVLLRIVTRCYLLLIFRGKFFLSMYLPGSHFIFVSNPRIPCCICSLGLLRVFTRCYLLLHP